MQFLMGVWISATILIAARNKISKRVIRDTGCTAGCWKSPGFNVLLRKQRHNQHWLLLCWQSGFKYPLFKDSNESLKKICWKIPAMICLDNLKKKRRKGSDSDVVSWCANISLKEKTTHSVAAII